MKYIDKFNTDLILSITTLDKNYNKLKFSDFKHCICRFYTKEYNTYHIDCTYDKDTDTYINLLEESNGDCFAIINANDLKCLPKGELVMEFIGSLLCPIFEDDRYDCTDITYTDITLIQP
jgi:hypothetical protein